LQYLSVWIILIQIIKLNMEVNMASSALNVLSGVAAAAAGLAGEKVSTDGKIPGLDLAAIVPALLGKSGGAAGVLGGALASVAKTGLLNNSKLGDLAGSLFSFGKAETTKKASGGIEGLAQAIVGNSGTGASLGSIASLASTLVGSGGKKEQTSIASELGKTLSSKFGVSFNGGSTAIKALDKVTGNDTKGDLFKAILKGLS
jgi:hypothetical protein